MKINTHELKRKSEIAFKGVQPIKLHGLQSPNSITECNVQIEGNMSKKGNHYIIEGIGKTTLPLICDRCLEPFDSMLEVKLYQKYVTDPNQQDEETLVLPESELDLEDIVIEAVSLNVPMKRLHDKACKGICKVCGINLNEKSCQCEQNEIDPRLEGLKDLFRSTN